MKTKTEIFVAFGVAALGIAAALALPIGSVDAAVAQTPQVAASV